MYCVSVRIFEREFKGFGTLNSIEKKYNMLFQTIESKNIINTRKLLYEILSININKHELIETSLRYFSNKVSDISQFLSFAAEIESKMNKSYGTFSTEYFIMNIMGLHRFIDYIASNMLFFGLIFIINNKGV